MSKGSYLPLDLVPDWLVESPITFDDLKCTSPPSTIYRMSLPPSPVVERRSYRNSRINDPENENAHQYPRDSMVSIIASDDSESDDEDDDEPNTGSTHVVKTLDLLDMRFEEPVGEHESVHAVAQDAPSFLWDNDADADVSSDSSDDDATLNEDDDDISPIDPFFIEELKTRTPTPAAPTPTPSHASSFDCSSPWFMHFDASALSALDDQLLQSPFDAFADLCYAHAVQMPDADLRATPGAYSWRRFSPLRPLSTFSEESSQHESPEATSHLELADEEEEEAEESSDSDSDQLASPEQVGERQNWERAAVGRPRVYSPTPASHHPHPHRHARHFHQESDGSIQLSFRPQAASPPFACAQLPPSPFGQDSFAKEPEPHSLLSKPLPLLPPRTPSPFSFTHRQAQSASLAFPHHHPHHLRSPISLDDLRSVTASPPPMHLPSPAVSQAQLAFLFGSPPKPAESVHFFPAPAAPHGGKGKEEAKGRPRRGTLRISTATNATGGSSGTWFKRIRAGFSPGS